MSDVGGSTSDPMDYQDVRDDRVMTYFDLPFNWSNDKNMKQSRTYRIQLNAAYAGRYFLPAVACEAMYDNRIRAISPGKWVEVMKLRGFCPGILSPGSLITLGAFIFDNERSIFQKIGSILTRTD